MDIHSMVRVAALLILSTALAPFAGATPPVPVETVTGCVKDGRMLIQAPDRFKRERPLTISPCTNIPFEFKRFEGKQIRATAGIDHYNGAFVCPRDVMILGDCKTDKVAAPARKDLPRQITDDQADEIVWALPEVQALIKRMEGAKAAPFSMITGYPNPDAEPGKPGAFYEVYVGERHDTHTVRVLTLIVDAYSGKVSVYDEAAEKIIPIEEYRKRTPK
ncbi:MAG: hypothetical protein A4E67_01059 [Syntrophaceae bacterium PtaB.Bin038]|nr:MAG: hypothetical protein A4E67_01059 [Syntrophaceae bacterium PtaB.Bin038]